jgi:hypothetical protein
MIIDCSYQRAKQTPKWWHACKMYGLENNTTPAGFGGKHIRLLL